MELSYVPTGTWKINGHKLAFSNNEIYTVTENARDPLHCTMETIYVKQKLTFYTHISHNRPAINGRFHLQIN